MNQEDRNALFEEAKRKRKEQQQQAEERKDFVTFDPVKYATMDYGKYNQIRIIGNPPHMRGDDPFSPMVVNYSKIINDEGRQFSCKWPSKNEEIIDSTGTLIKGGSWILWRLYNKVMAYEWVPEGQGYRSYYNAKSHPALFNRVNKNNKVDNNLEKGWTPKTYVVANVLDRAMMDWHKEHKHTAILSSKVNIQKKETDKGVEERAYYDIGIPYTTFMTKIWDEIAGKYAGDFQNYDLMLTKTHTIEKGKDVYNYVVYHAGTDRVKFIEEAPKFVEKYATLPLSAEELSWERYNLSQMYAPTSYKVIMKNLSIFFQAVDKEMGTNFYKELTDLVAREEVYQNANKSEEEKVNSHVSEPEEEDVPEDVPEVKQEATIPRKSRVAVVETPKVNGVSREDLNSLIEKGFEGIEKLTDAEIALIDSINLSAIDEQDVIKWKSGILPASCTRCDFASPEDYHACPKCGGIFQ